MGMRWVVAAVAAVLPFAAEARDVDLELVLAVDVSASIDEDEARLQRDGFIAAITSPEILRAIKSGPLGRIAVTYVEWAGYDAQNVAVAWTEITDEGDARRFASRIESGSGFRGHWTSISSVIDRSLALFGTGGFKGVRRVIDISGDGENNNGDVVLEARTRAVDAGVTINGLPIINGRVGPNGMAPAVDLELYYRDCVIGGTGAFLVVARGFPDFARAVRRKLFLELSGHRPPARARPAAFTPSADCLAGEKRTQKELQELNDLQKDRKKSF